MGEATQTGAGAGAGLGGGGAVVAVTEVVMSSMVARQEVRREFHVWGWPPGCDREKISLLVWLHWAERVARCCRESSLWRGWLEGPCRVARCSPRLGAWGPGRRC